MKSKQATVFVGLSGGVDSSVAAARLLERGYNVVGVFIKVWHPDWLPCNWEEERRYAMRVAASLGIPFVTCDAEREYYEDVAQYFVSEYAAGRTPNPDVMCNKYVKFGAFLRFARTHGADYVATGHYAQVTQASTGEHMLYRGIDNNKDQSYFLWTLTEEQLAYTLFPIGDTPKKQIRQEAEKRSLPTAKKKDSQGICFLGQVDMYDFLKEFIDLVPGTVLDTQGREIGTHKGSYVYTVGQRHGYDIDVQTTTAPHYVVAIDHTKNTLTVDTKPPATKTGHVIKLEECNWIGDTPAHGSAVTVQLRYRQDPIPAIVHIHSDGRAEVELQNKSVAPAGGQSCVLYDADRCLGGGIIV